MEGLEIEHSSGKEDSWVFWIGYRAACGTPTPAIHCYLNKISL